MAPAEPTPCNVFFSIMKKYGGISYKDMAGMILSSKPLIDGKSPVSRANDRSWVSRFIIHAPAGSLQSGYFCEPSVSALRVISKLKAKGRKTLSSAEILELIYGSTGEAMVSALQACGQDIPLYRNMLYRIANDTGFTIDERTEIAMTFFVGVACTANVKKAAESALEFSKNVHGTGMTTPMVTPSGAVTTHVDLESIIERSTLGLIRTVDGYIVGSPHWIDFDTKEVEIGSFALGENTITDVESDVSSHHAIMRLDDEGNWLISGLGSKNGTYLISGLDGTKIVVEAPESERSDSEVQESVQVHPGDEIVLGANTHFMVVEGVPNM